MKALCRLLVVAGCSVAATVCLLASLAAFLHVLLVQPAAGLAMLLGPPFALLFLCGVWILHHET